MQRDVLLLIFILFCAAPAGFAQTTFAFMGGLDAMWTNEQKGGAHFVYTYGNRDRDKPYLRLGPQLGFTAAHSIARSTRLRASVNTSLLYVNIESTGSRFPVLSYQTYYYSLLVSGEQTFVKKFLVGAGFAVRFMPAERYGLNDSYYQKGEFVASEPRSPTVEYYHEPGEKMIRRVGSRTIGLTATVGYVVNPRWLVVLSHFYPLKESFTHPTHIPELSVTRLAFRYGLSRGDK